MAIKGIIPISELPYFIDSLTGKTAEVLRGFGFRPAVGLTATGEDIWSGTATTLPIPPDVGEQMAVVSTSANDKAAGPGVRTVAISYIDANGIQQTESVTMNGTTSVDTVATNIRFVQEIYTTTPPVLTSGASLVAAGTISIATSGTPANIYTQIQAGTNQSLNTARMVPAGKTLIITGYHGSTAGGKATVDIRLRSTSHRGLLLPRIFTFIDNFVSFNSASDRNYTQPIFVPSLAIVKVTAYTPIAGTDAQASWEGVLLDNPT